MHTLAPEISSGRRYAVEVNVNNPNVPYGDSFYTHGRYCFTYESPTSSRMTCFFDVVFTKSNLLRRTFISAPMPAPCPPPCPPPCLPCHLCLPLFCRLLAHGDSRRGAPS